MRNGTPPNATLDPAHRPDRYATLLWLGLLLVLAAFLRGYRLSEQSVWLDEFFSLAHRDAPSLSMFLTLLHFFTPDGTPLGFTFIYLWGRLVGTGDILWLRLGVVLISLACIPLLYAIGRRVGGHRTGLIAAFLLAVSPMHVWTGQSLRPNVFVECAALISIYALLRAYPAGSRLAWCCNALANLALLWMHPFTAFLIGAEGLFLLSFGRSGLKRVLFWGTIHALFALSPLLWLRTSIADVPLPEDDFVMAAPRIGGFLCDWLGDDAVQSCDSFVFQGDTWFRLGGVLRTRFIAAHKFLDPVLILFFAACLVCTLKHWLQRRRTAPDDHNAALMLLVSTAPLFIALALTFLWRPCIQPRYTSYCSFAFYVMAGALLSGLRRPAVRRMLLAGLALLYAYQLSFVLPASTRTNWLLAGQLIRQQASPHDLILLRGTQFSWETYRLNVGESSPAPVEAAYTLQAVCDKAADFLSVSPNTGTSVWALIEPFVYQLPPLSAFENALRSRGLRHTLTTFAGMNGLQLYRIERSAAPLPGGALAPIPSRVDYEALARDMEIRPDQLPAALQALRRAVDTEWPRTRYYYSFLAFRFADDGHPDLAAAAARRALALDPDYPLAALALSIALFEQGDAAGGRNAYNHARASDRVGYCACYEDLLHTLYEAPEPETARHVFERLDRWGLYLPQVLRRHFRSAPAAPAPGA